MWVRSAWSSENMKSTSKNKPTHIVKGNIFDALGFSASEASALKVKAEILSSLTNASVRRATRSRNLSTFWMNISRQ